MNISRDVLRSLASMKRQELKQVVLSLSDAEYDRLTAAIRSDIAGTQRRVAWMCAGLRWLPLILVIHAIAVMALIVCGILKAGAL
jgi:hypothetical protein